MRLSWFVLAVLVWVPCSAVAQAAEEPADEQVEEDRYRISLMTMEQGRYIWEHFGHNALVIEDRLAGTRVAWHWGLFSFTEPGFIPRFLEGEMMYWMGGFDAGAMERAYEGADRTITVQELDVTQAQARALQEFVHLNALPENRYYRYDYFIDNCSTRLRDALDQVLDGQLAEQFAGQSANVSYRHETERLTGRAPLDYLGVTLMLGPKGDVIRTKWEQTFTPLNLRLWLRDVNVAGPDGPHPLVASERTLFEGTRPAALQEPPAMLLPMAMIGVLLGGLFVLFGRVAEGAGRLRALPLASLGFLWSLLAGVVGVLLIGVYWTDHIWMYGNENVLQLSPISLLAAVALPVALLRGGTLRRTRWLVFAAAGVAVLGMVAQLLPAVDQVNGVIVALAVPAHLGLAWSIDRLATARASDSSALRGAAP